MVQPLEARDSGLQNKKAGHKAGSERSKGRGKFFVRRCDVRARGPQCEPTPKRSARGGQHRTSVLLSGGRLWHQRADTKNAEGFERCFPSSLMRILLERQGWSPWPDGLVHEKAHSTPIDDDSISNQLHPWIDLGCLPSNRQQMHPRHKLAKVNASP